MSGGTLQQRKQTSYFFSDHVRAVFISFCISTLRHWLKNSRHSVVQLDVYSKAVTHSHDFPRFRASATCIYVVIWLVNRIVWSLVIGRRITLIHLQTLHGSTSVPMITCFPADIISYISSTYDLFSSIHRRNICVIFRRHDWTPAAQLASIRRVLWNLKRRIEGFVQLPNHVIEG